MCYYNINAFAILITDLFEVDTNGENATARSMFFAIFITDLFKLDFNDKNECLSVFLQYSSQLYLSLIFIVKVLYTINLSSILASRDLFKIPFHSENATRILALCNILHRFE